MDYLIQQGTVVTSDRIDVCDILISGGKISAVGKDISFPENTRIIDARELYVFPGGIDPHVHLDLPTPAGPSSDDFKTGSIAALFGGTTSFIDFVTPSKNESLIAALEKRMKVAEKSEIEYGFHMGITSWGKDTAKEMECCVRQYGITSFKTYLAYKGSIGIDESILFEVMKTAAALNALVTVHCEMGDEIVAMQNEFIAAGKTSPKYHALSRPADCESRSMKNVIDLAKQAGCPVYIVHTSAEGSLRHIEEAQQSGQIVYSETCPQYLLLDDSKYDLPLPGSLAFVMSPPLRKISDQEYLWEGLKKESIQVVATDHCPFHLKGQKDKGINNFTRIPNGAGGIEHRLPLLFTYGVFRNRISLNQFVAFTSTNPARIFGLYPKKGEIAVGSDADLVLWDPEIESIISARTHHQRCDTNIYEGFNCRGKAVYVFAGGKLKISIEDFEGFREA
jgi:dihydropyrimidinase